MARPKKNYKAAARKSKHRETSSAATSVATSAQPARQLVYKVPPEELESLREQWRKNAEDRRMFDRMLAAEIRGPKYRSKPPNNDVAPVAGVTWVIQEVGRMKAADKFLSSKFKTKTALSKEIASRMGPAVRSGACAHAFVWRYISNQLVAWGCWPI
jgi:hypothetical protein